MNQYMNKYIYINDHMNEYVIGYIFEKIIRK